MLRFPVVAGGGVSESRRVENRRDRLSAHEAASRRLGQGSGNTTSRWVVSEELQRTPTVTRAGSTTDVSRGESANARRHGWPRLTERGLLQPCGVYVV